MYTINGTSDGVSNPNSARASVDVRSTVADTTLSVASSSGTYGGTTTLSATLMAGSTAVGGKTVSFTLGGFNIYGHDGRRRVGDAPECEHRRHHCRRPHNRGDIRW